jgi:hypothetical protein
VESAELIEALRRLVAGFIIHAGSAARLASLSTSARYCSIVAGCNVTISASLAHFSLPSMSARSISSSLILGNQGGDIDTLGYRVDQALKFA